MMLMMPTGREDGTAAWTHAFLRAGRRLERGFRPRVSGQSRLLSAARR